MKRAMWVLVAMIVVASGCTDDGSSSDPVGNDCPGERVEVDGTAYCVFIEEGFLTEACPEDFPFGEQIAGVIVCAEEDNIPKAAVEEELERLGLAKDDELECTDPGDCPSGEPSEVCEGDTLVIDSGWSSDCMDGACIIPPVAPPQRIDCTEDGRVCREGACVFDDACQTDDDCPSSPPSAICEGDVLMIDHGSFSACFEGVCEPAPGLPPEELDCAAEGQICMDGECVDAGDECNEETNCQSIPPSQTCEGDILTIDYGLAAGCSNGECVIAPGLPPEVIDCTESGQICTDGECVDPGADCTEDADCPQPVPFFGCEGPEAVSILGAGVCNERNQCEITGGEQRTNCEEQGDYCSAGSCVQPGRPCDTTDDCPQPDNAPFCTGDILTEPSPSGAECLDNVCTLVGAPVLPMETDCSETGQICRQRQCQ